MRIFVSNISGVAMADQINRINEIFTIFYANYHATYVILNLIKIKQNCKKKAELTF
jgi:hypothetical protein